MTLALRRSIDLSLCQTLPWLLLLRRRRSFAGRQILVLGILAVRRHSAGRLLQLIGRNRAHVSRNIVTDGRLRRVLLIVPERYIVLDQRVRTIHQDLSTTRQQKLLAEDVRVLII